MNWQQGKVIACPHCGAPNNGVAAADGDDVPPPTGAISFCMKCGGLAVYTDEHQLRKANDAEEAEYSVDPMIVRGRQMLTYTDSVQLASSFLAMAM